MTEPFRATDDDLPQFIIDGTLPDVPKIDAQKRASIAVSMHYPEITAKQKKREERASKKAEREGRGLQDGKKFVKIAKKLQMFDMLRGLEQTFCIMRQAERGFCTDLLAKFRKYTPYGIKWITRKQYDWLKQIADTYIQLPRT